MQRMVVGFMFDAEGKRVALIRKTKPAWQAGLLNGVGGKIEKGESESTAMVREFCEETGYQTYDGFWESVCILKGPGRADGYKWELHVYAATIGNGEFSKIKTTEEEEVVIVSVGDVNPLREDLIDNLPWLIAYSRWRVCVPREEYIKGANGQRQGR